MLDALDAGAVRGWCRSAADTLRRRRGEIDALNVFPVADTDTGTNLHLTVEAAAEAAEEPANGADLDATWRALARGALSGARGNSGVIVSQVWRGLAETLPGAAPCRGQALSRGLRHAAGLAYEAVARPVEGTVLTVARAAGDAAADSRSDDLAAVARAAADGARGALGATTRQLDALSRAGVVDAGAAGLCVVLDALVTVVGDREAGMDGPEPARNRTTPQASRYLLSATSDAPDTADAPDGPDTPDTPDARRAPGPAPDARPGPSYEVMYLLDASPEKIGPLRARLDVLGESLLVAGGERLWNVHVHTDDAGAAIEAGMAAGRPHHLRVSYLGPGRGHATGAGRGAVAVATGEGVAALLAGSGATVVRPDQEGRLPVVDVLDAIRRAGDEVAVLPNDSEGRAPVEAAAARARDEGRHVSVVPAKATVQGLAALAVHDARRRFDDDVVAMTAAAGATRAGAVTMAGGAAVTSAGICAAGDALGLIDGDVAVLGSDVAAVAVEVVDRMLAGGGELVTLVTGSEADPGVTEGVGDHLRGARPDVDLAVYAGGDPASVLLVGVE